MIKAYIEKAKKILEHAGSEGLSYRIKARKLSAMENEILKITEVKQEDNIYSGKVFFFCGQDYGFATKTLADMGIEIIGLELIY